MKFEKIIAAAAVSWDFDNPTATEAMFSSYGKKEMSIVELVGVAVRIHAHHTFVHHMFSNDLLNMCPTPTVCSFPTELQLWRGMPAPNHEKESR